jgi:NADPH2:quinone reductase
MKAIRVHGPGGPEALVYEEVADPVLAAGQALVRVEAIGVNFAERNARLTATAGQQPAVVGGEAAGTVVSVSGPGEFKAGDRVVFNGVQGAYAELIAVPLGRLIRIPDNVTTKQAAATLLQGMTAHYLACSIYPLKTGDSCLVHAAAGGVGLLLCQIAKMRGARVLGTVSSEAKAQAARANGADEAINYTQQDFEAEVKRLTNNEGVNAVYDSVGKDTFLKGFSCLKPRGTLALYGQASGAIEPFDSSVLQRGSLFFTRAGLATYTATREELVQRASDVLGWVGSGAIKVHIHAEYPLSEAGQAQAAIENRATIGKVLLIP